MVPTSNLLARNKTEEVRRDALLTVGKPSRLASGVLAAQEVRRDALLTVGKPSRLAPEGEVRRITFLRACFLISGLTPPLVSDYRGPILAPSSLFGSLFEPMNQFVFGYFVISRVDEKRGNFAFARGELLAVQAQESQAGK